MHNCCRNAVIEASKRRNARAACLRTRTDIGVLSRAGIDTAMRERSNAQHSEWQCNFTDTVFDTNKRPNSVQNARSRRHARTLRAPARAQLLTRKNKPPTGGS